MNCIAAMTGICFLLQPFYTGLILSTVFFAFFSALILWRLVLIFMGVCLRLLAKPNPTALTVAEDLPVYSILVPAYREAELMPQLAAALCALNWPSQKLDIQILLEADDLDTWRAARQAKFPFGTRLTLVPVGGPRTKPNALNFGLASATGKYVVVYDVEDRPHPDQLIAAHLAFSQATDRVVCLQAPLKGENRVHSWLSTHWSLEYDVQFGLLLPALSIYRMPILLGGTSNHFRRSALLALGGWDAWNVTEDADLGMRIARAGLWTSMIRPPTYEDAPVKFNIWLAQRSRWIKGFLQTWLVLMRRPAVALRQMGALPFIVMQLCLGGAILAPLLHGPFFLLACLALLSGSLQVGLLGWGLLSGGLLVGVLSDLAAPGPWSIRRLAAIITRPLYWPLLSLAAYRAIWELVEKPFFWAKTPHQPYLTNGAPTCSTGSSA